MEAGLGRWHRRLPFLDLKKRRLVTIDDLERSQPVAEDGRELWAQTMLRDKEAGSREHRSQRPVSSS